MAAIIKRFGDSESVFNDDNATDITSTTTVTSTTTSNHSLNSEDTKLASLDNFTAYMIRFGKNHSELELEKRFEAFKISAQLIKEINSNLKHTFKAGHTQFSDMTHEDFQAQFLGYSQRPRSDQKFLSSNSGLQQGSHPTPSDVSTLPSSVDWNAAGAVTPVLNQGTCGSCWAFSSTGAIEGARQIKTGILTALSQQELVDCGGSQFPRDLLGCGGGDFDAAFEFVSSNGLDSESSYGYASADGQATTCTSSSAGRLLAITAGELLGYHTVQTTDTLAMMSAVASQPVSIAIDADATFKQYESGVYNAPCGSVGNHAVLMIGYGSDNGNDYWLVKNSWSTDWGEQGFVRMARDSCYFFSASYPVVTDGTAPGLIEDTSSCFHNCNMSGFLALLFLLVQLLFMRKC